MTDKEEAALIATGEHCGSLRDQTILTVILHTDLRTMEICNLTPGDIQIGKRSGQLIV
jgi:integrase/recombinase XerC